MAATFQCPTVEIEFIADSIRTPSQVVDLHETKDNSRRCEKKKVLDQLTFVQASYCLCNCRAKLSKRLPGRPCLCAKQYLTPRPKAGLQTKECGARKINPGRLQWTSSRGTWICQHSSRAHHQDGQLGAVHQGWVLTLTWLHRHWFLMNYNRTTKNN